jgi:hypothetical protein
MERAGLVRFVPHETDLIDKAGIKKSDLGGIQGYYDGKRIWLVENNLHPGNAKGVLLHEVAHASAKRDSAGGLKEMLGTLHDSLRDHYNRLLDAGDETAKAAERRLEAANVAPETKDEERLAYFVEEAAKRDKPAKA